MNGLMINSDPFCIEALHRIEELSTIVNTKNVVENPLITRYNSRYQGTNLLYFLHGRCLRFQNFVFSVLKYGKSKFVPLFLECSSSPDSVNDKIFECQSNEEMVDLRSQLTSLKELEVNSIFDFFSLMILALLWKSFLQSGTVNLQGIQIQG